ncbi:F-box/LRR-repeat protein [Trifolium medium]|uniref:F-box/LRR-repeat protein n=1 Tax=Trifolium medium TaxID=97028 RepID=A0A392M3Q9_9FABA|nr:F-box/LRR-repeat protein [Trifolium medium]
MQNTVEMININDFPDEILTQILFFLPYKQAFRTTILSKRWRLLPCSLAILDIDDYSVMDINDWFRFRQFMNKLIFSPHSRHLPLTSFYLNCHSTRGFWDWATYDLWIKAAKHCHVKLLSLFFLSTLAMGMAPYTIFCCKTLVVLRLRNANMTCCSVDLPLLKELYLSKVRFSDMDDLNRLVYGCPILEILTTSFVETSNGVAVGGGYLKPLSNLIKAEIHLFDVPFRTFCNVQSLTIFEVESNSEFG